MIKLICCDVDGTLLNKHREVDIYTQEVFKTIKDNISVVLASSRMPKALYHIQQDLSIISSPMICYNGGLILSGGGNFSEQQILGSYTIGKKIITEILLFCQSSNLHASVYYNDTWVATKMDSWAEREINNTKVSPDRYLSAGFDNSGSDAIQLAHKVMVMGTPEKIDILENGLTLKSEVALCRSKPTYLEITPRDTNKSLALKLLLSSYKEYHGITLNEIMAFGDSHNDYELIRDVKFGIAVENAVDSIKAVAYAVTISNTDNGVAHYLQNFLLEQEN